MMMQKKSIFDVVILVLLVSIAALITVYKCKQHEKEVVVDKYEELVNGKFYNKKKVWHKDIMSFYNSFKLGSPTNAIVFQDFLLDVMHVKHPDIDIENLYLPKILRDIMYNKSKHRCFVCCSDMYDHQFEFEMFPTIKEGKIHYTYLYGRENHHATTTAVIK